MKKFYLLLSLALSSLLGYGQCTVDNSLTVPGIYSPGATVPDSIVVMPLATYGVPYDQTAQLVVPLDTTLDTLGFIIPATVDSMQIVNFIGLPASLSYNCDNADCFWFGGDNGCVKITGTPTMADLGTHNVVVRAEGWATVTGLGQQTGVFDFYMTIEVVAPISLTEREVINQTFSIYPSPMGESTTVSFATQEANPYSLTIMDITGRMAQQLEGVTQRGDNKVQVLRNEMASGLYLYTLTVGEVTRSGRLMVK